MPMYAGRCDSKGEERELYTCPRMQEDAYNKGEGGMLCACLSMREGG